MIKVQLHWGPGPLAATVVDNQDGTYEVGYTVEVSGEYMIAVLVGGNPIAGSPFYVTALIDGSVEDIEYRQTGVLPKMDSLMMRTSSRGSFQMGPMGESGSPGQAPRRSSKKSIRAGSPG